MTDIIRRPLVTEKNTHLSSLNVYAFEVDRRATKLDVKKAVEKAFRVKVATVRTSICRDRVRRTGRSLSKIKYWKKAFVKLAPGEKIHLFEGA